MNYENEFDPLPPKWWTLTEEQDKEMHGYVFLSVFHFHLILLRFSIQVPYNFPFAMPVKSKLLQNT